MIQGSWGDEKSYDSKTISIGLESETAISEVEKKSFTLELLLWQERRKTEQEMICVK
jgi:hypothetical protein